MTRMEEALQAAWEQHSRRYVAPATPGNSYDFGAGFAAGYSAAEEENTRLRKTIEALRSRQAGLLRGREELAQVLRERTR